MSYFSSDKKPFRKLENPGFPCLCGVLDFFIGKYTVYAIEICYSSNLPTNITSKHLQSLSSLQEIWRYINKSSRFFNERTQNSFTTS
jgi:hypothetical protein